MKLRGRAEGMGDWAGPGRVEAVRGRVEAVMGPGRVVAVRGRSRLLRLCGAVPAARFVALCRSEVAAQLTQSRFSRCSSYPDKAPSPGLCRRLPPEIRLLWGHCCQLASVFNELRVL